jgi:hypothetical protein
VFFGIATWNVGEINFPTTNWQSTTTQSFYIDLGSTQHVKSIYFWVASGNASADISIGSPGNWTYEKQFSLQSRATDYMVQPSLDLDVTTK